MINILFDCPNIDDFYDDLKPYFTGQTRVAVVAFSFYDDYVKDAKSWESVYGKGIGNCYFETVDSLARFGVKPQNVSFINYFTDTQETAKKKILDADTVYFHAAELLPRQEEHGPPGSPDIPESLVFQELSGCYP